jgi:hypothetical protein
VRYRPPVAKTEFGSGAGSSPASTVQLPDYSPRLRNTLARMWPLSAGVDR